MPDFTHPAWSWGIAAVTIVSIIALTVLVLKMSTRRSGPDSTTTETSGHVWDENLEEYNNPMPRWWLGLFYITLAWGVVYLVLYPGLGAFPGILGWSQTDQYDGEVAQAEARYGPLFEKYRQVEMPELATNAEAVAMGERLFSTYCATCHGSDARGARGFPNLRDDEWQYGGDPATITATITDGRSGIMPAWGDALGDEAVEAVTRYVEHLTGREVARKTVAEGKAIYDVNCIACHGADGRGNALLGAPDLTDDVWLYGGSTTKIRESIAAGRNGVMPPHGEFLGPAKIHLIGAYIYQFRLN